MDAVIYAPLNSFDTGLSNLIISLQTSPTYATAPAATESLLAAEVALSSALSLLEKHQRNHARILQLRAEALQLEENVRSIVTEAGDFRKQLDGIAPGVLDEDSEDEDEDFAEASWKDVDYNTLLDFARAVGKYNADAEKDAELQEQRLRIEARKKAARPNGAPTTTNGVQPGADSKAPEAANQILDRAAGWLNQTTEERRVIGRMAFPGSERLRLGILGQLQATREEHGGGEKGEEAVEREVEKLIATAEGRELVTGKDDEDHEMGGASSHDHRSYQASGHPHAKQEEKKALDLDLWNESDDDDG